MISTLFYFFASMSYKNHQKERLKSLDAIRGLTMFTLIGLGSIFSSLPYISNNTILNWLSFQSKHPEWQGFTMWDLIFPLFIFIMGVAIPFSFKNRRSTKKYLYKHITIRSITLLIIGIILWQQPGGAHPHYGYYHILYRIAFSYFFASLIILNSNIHKQLYWAIGLFLGHWILLRFVPVPEYGIGNFTREGNMNSYIETMIGMFVSPKVKYMLSPSLIPSVSNALLGAIIGNMLLSNNDKYKNLKKLLVIGSVLVFFGLLVHLDFPINKKLGSPSFTLLAAGICVLLLSFFYWIVDLKGYTKWAFFLIVVGMNPLAIYIFTTLVDFNIIANVFVGGFNLSRFQPLVVVLTATTLKWLFVYYLYKQKFFFKI